MNLPQVDIELLSRALEALHHLTGLSWSLYDQDFRLLIAPRGPDPLGEAFRRLRPQQYSRFLQEHCSLALRTRRALAMAGPTARHYLFLPLQGHEAELVAVGAALCLNPSEFIKFYHTQGTSLGIASEPAELWLQRLPGLPPERLGAYLEGLQGLLQGMLEATDQLQGLKRRWQWHKTITTIMANTKRGASPQEICRTVAEAVVFLFGAEAAVVLTLNRDSQGLRPLATAGRPLWEGLRLQGQHEAVREALQKGEAVALTEPLKLRQMGLPEEVLSLHLFALSAQPAALLAALNCPLSGEALQCVQELCRLAEHLFRAAYKSWQHRRASTVLRGLSHKASALSGLYQEPQRLYQQVVEEAAALLGARRCSLMLPERTGALKVVAVKGMNPHLLQDVQVRIGEAIAGRVFKEQSPLLLKEPQEFRHLGAELKPMFRTSSCLSIPLSIGQEPLGVLNLADKASGQAFNRADLELLGPFSQQVALLLKLSLCYQGWMQMKELSFTDALTGLYNRRYFDMRLREEHQRARRHGLQLSLALMDIDDFKLFNDTEGHLAGDRMLKEIASIIQSTIRVNDIAVRFGGEEFALLMPQTSKAKALKVAERLRSNIRRLTQQGWRKYPKEALTISIGVATFPECGPEPQGLIRCADKALYMAKAQGKDRTVPWHCSPQGTEQMLQRLP